MKARGRALGWAALVSCLGLATWIGHALLALPTSEEIALLARRPPKTTALIEARAAAARAQHRSPRRVQRWAPMEGIAPELVACVIAAEDARFFVHDGVDVHQIRDALKKDLTTGRYTRGASTLTQQLAKNLWLSEQKSLLRKLKELVLAHRLEEALSKERILELYLNEAEWGDGIYGAEAASQAYFGKAARDLTLAEAAELAAMLPAPRRLAPRRSPRALLARAQHVLDRVAEEKLASEEAALAARAELARRLDAHPLPSPLGLASPARIRPAKEGPGERMTR